MNTPQVCNGTDLCRHDPPCTARCYRRGCAAAAFTLTPREDGWTCKEHAS